MVIDLEDVQNKIQTFYTAKAEFIGFPVKVWISPKFGFVGMCITGCLMELWVTLFAGRGKAAL